MSDVTPQPDPKPNVSDAVWSAVIADMHARDAEGSEAPRPGENKTPRGGWCLAPVPAWARVAMDDARTLPTRGARCPVWTAKPPAVDPRQVSLLEIKG